MKRYNEEGENVNFANHINKTFVFKIFALTFFVIYMI